ncbi:MAG: hypothetical protein ACJ8FY_18810 [Gemmataceae bacterium]
MRFAVCLALFPLLGSSLAAAEPAAGETLPIPRPIPSRVILQTVPYRVSAYEVWQNYGVDRFGRFRPRVVYSPYGSYYYANGAPFPWVETHTRDFVPFIGNAANFAASLYQDTFLTDPQAFMPYCED